MQHSDNRYSSSTGLAARPVSVTAEDTQLFYGRTGCRGETHPTAFTYPGRSTIGVQALPPLEEAFGFRPDQCSQVFHGD